jgi:predicted nucleotidyltransferase
MIYTKQSTTIAIYRQSERQFYERVHALLGDDLLLYCITGSLARGYITLDWSDIDILLVVKKYRNNALRNIQEAIDSADAHIKIGITSYSRAEFEDLQYIDTKTLLAIQRIKDGTYIPRVIAEGLSMPELSDQQIRMREQARFPELLHKYKRSLQKYSPENERELYKQAIDLLKITIRSESKSNPITYTKVLSDAAKHLPNWSAPLFLPNVIMEDILPPEQRLARYHELLDWFMGVASEKSAHTSRPSQLENPQKEIVWP